MVKADIKKASHSGDHVPLRRDIKKEQQAIPVLFPHLEVIACADGMLSGLRYHIFRRAGLYQPVDDVFIDGCDIFIGRMFACPIPRRRF